MSVPGVVVIGKPVNAGRALDVGLTGEMWCRVLKVTLVDPDVAVMKKIRWERQSTLTQIDIR